MLNNYDCLILHIILAHRIIKMSRSMLPIMLQIVLTILLQTPRESTEQHLNCIKAYVRKSFVGF